MFIALTFLAGCQSLREVPALVYPEEKELHLTPIEELPAAPIPDEPPPRTISAPDNGQADLILSLDEAIRIAFDNSEVVRVLTGVTATSSGRTIYDPGIASTAIDQARGRFDPTMNANNSFSRNENPQGLFDPFPPDATINGFGNNGYNLDAGLSKINPFGGTASLQLGVIRTDIEPGQQPLNPQTSNFTQLSYVQPLLKGAGLNTNLAPILIAGINTERSFFQFKDSVQELVRGVIEGYWSLVFARTDRWARQQQVNQAELAYRRELARKNRGFGDLADVAQTRLALANFRANLIAAESNVLTREAALLNILGISPTEVGEVIPTTPPHKERVAFEWDKLVSLAERYRPDVIELKLVIEADRQQEIIARNDSKPNVDAVAKYRWDGLQGSTPAGQTISTFGGEYTDWTLGINFSVPLGLRQARATVRQRELTVARDQANLRQGLHNAVHQLALDVRNLDQSHEQYQAFVETREAARDNLLQQGSEYYNGRTIFLNVLQAIADWGNAVSNEAQSLTQYNTQLATIERDTGTILETHGVRFLEERHGFAGPLGHIVEQLYPATVTPETGPVHYPTGNVPAEQSFDLTNPIKMDLFQIDQPRTPPTEEGYDLLYPPGERSENPTRQ